jgi:hypothetical protein
MNKTLDKLFTNNVALVLLFLLIHLTVVYTKAIYFLNPDKIQVWYDLPLAIFIALGYSFITITNIRQGGNVRNNIVFALLDGIAVFIYYTGLEFTNLYVICISTFFAFLTGYGVYSIGHISLKIYHKKEDIEVKTQEIEDLKKQLLEVKENEQNLKAELSKLIEKNAQKEEFNLVCLKGYYLYIKGRFKIGKEENKKAIAESFEKKAEEIDIDIIDYTLKNNYE